MRSKIFIIILILFILCGLISPANAQTHAINGEYITEWLILGPFFPNDLETDFLADVGGEANIEPKEDDTVTTADGSPLLIWLMPLGFTKSHCLCILCAKKRYCTDGGGRSGK